MKTAKEFRADAISQIGKPYILGAEASATNNNPKAFDCSELVEWLFNRNGTPIGDLAASQYDKTVKATGDPRVGDLVFLKNNSARWNGIGHVAVVTGKLSNGDWEIVEARGRNYGVVKTTLSYWKTRQYYTGLRRFPAFKLRTTRTPHELVTLSIFRQRNKNTTGRDKAIAKLKSARVRGLWSELYASWDSIIRSTTLSTTLATTNHIFVVLGAGLQSDGELSRTFKRRLETALIALQAYPTQNIIVSGGAPKNGKTEASVGKAWLVSQGIDAKRIIAEPNSSSTVSNARNSIKIMRDKGYKTYTLITSYSHMYRALVLFKAADVRERLNDKNLTAITCIANYCYADTTSQTVDISVTALHASIVMNVYKAYLKLVS